MIRPIMFQEFKGKGLLIPKEGKAPGDCGQWSWNQSSRKFPGQLCSRVDIAEQ